MSQVIIIEEKKADGFLEDVQKGYEYIRRALECLEKQEGMKDRMEKVRHKFMPEFEKEAQERLGSGGHRMGDGEKPRQLTPYPRGLGYYRPETGYHQPDMYERGYYSGIQEQGMRPVQNGGQRGGMRGSGGMRNDRADAGIEGGSMNERYPYAFDPNNW